MTKPPRAPSGTSAATPTALPICAAALRTPEAMPCSESGRALVPDAVEATEAQPRPVPMSTNETTSAAGVSVSSAAAPAPIAASPTAIACGGRSIEPAITARLNGTHQRPASSAERPSSSCW